MKGFFLTTNSMYHQFTFRNLQNQLNQSIQTPKQNYFNKISKKLRDP